jgi:hypothetical protein
MGGKFKVIVGGIGFILLMAFAYIGFKSVFKPEKPEESRLSPLPMDFQANTPTINPSMGDKLASIKDTQPPPAETKPADNTQAPTEKPSLVDEPLIPSNNVTLTPPDELFKTPNSRPPDTSANVTLTPPDELFNTPTTRPPVAVPGTGKLEVLVQAAETGKAIPANVYVQRMNGENLDKRNYTDKASFSLRADTYKVTARTEGRASVTHTIKILGNAVVNEIFALPALDAPHVSPPAQAPSLPNKQQNTNSTRPSVTENGVGRLRLVALDADDGSPIMVDYTISRAEGGEVIDQVEHVSLLDTSVPAEEIIVSFNYRGFNGSQTLSINAGQTTTHTFNLRGVRRGHHRGDWGRN